MTRTSRRAGDATLTVETQPDRDVDHPPDRLAVRRRHHRDRPQPPATHPQPQHFSNFEHRDLPERHAHRLPGRDNNGGELTGPDTDDGGPGVVPSSWREVVPSNGDGWTCLPGENPLKWSHAAGGRHRGSPTPVGGPHRVGNFNEQNWGGSGERDQRSLSCRVTGGRPTPTSRQASGGDRHLKFHDVREGTQIQGLGLVNSRLVCRRAGAFEVVPTVTPGALQPRHHLHAASAAGDHRRALAVAARRAERWAFASGMPHGDKH
jgi:hypothetical protein